MFKFIAVYKYLYYEICLVKGPCDLLARLFFFFNMEGNCGISNVDCGNL